jgi:hypothetical protein
MHFKILSASFLASLEKIGSTAGNTQAAEVSRR